MDKWIVVYFEASNCVEAVPQKWYDTTTGELSYPPEDTYPPKKILDYIKRQFPAQVTWPVFQVQILGKEYDSYYTASDKARTALDSDYLSSANESIKLGRGKRRITRKRITSDESEEDEPLCHPFPTPTALKKKSNIVDQDQIEQNNHWDSQDACRETQTSIGCQETQSGQKKQKLLQFQDTPMINKSTLDSHKNYSGTQTSANTQGTQEFQRQVIRQLILMNSKLSQQGENIEFIIKEITKPTSSHQELGGDGEPDNFLSLLPLKDLENLMHLDSMLQEERPKNILAKELSRIGGENAKVLVKRILYRTMSNELGHLYSFEGAKGKKSFKELNLFKVILKAVRLNARTSNTCDDEIVTCIKGWLVQAGNRLMQKNRKELQVLNMDAGNNTNKN